MTAISVKHLSRQYKIYQRNSGLKSAIGSLFHRPYSIVKAVDDISFHITKGELVGFIGPNGAGKTTTLKCLSGLLFPSSGEIEVMGYHPYKRERAFLKNISLIMGQKNQMWWDLPAVETFRLNKAIYDLDDYQYEKTLQKLSNLLDVNDLMSTPVRQLSLGQRMKMELIASLIHNPGVLFLDEPTIGLDVIMQKKIRDFILEYNRIFKATIILTSHYMIDVRHLCKRVIIINKGKIIYDGNLDKLVTQYANFKTVKFKFSCSSINGKKLTRYGKIIKLEKKEAILNIPKNNVKNLISKILQIFPIDDLTIEEPEIEDVIRLVFNRSNRKT